MGPERDFVDDYISKSSPESCSDNCITADNMGSLSDEDFITQLSSDLDIPLLLNPGEDEMAVLNSFFDKTTDEILSAITFSPDYNMMNENSVDLKDFDFLNEVLYGDEGSTMAEDKSGKHDSEYSASSGSSKSNNHSNKVNYFEYLNKAVDPPPDVDIKAEHSDESCSSSNSLEPSTPPPIPIHKETKPSMFFGTRISPKKEPLSPVGGGTVQVVPQNQKSTSNCAKVPVKRVPIKPIAPYTVPVKNPNIVVIKNIKREFPSSNENHILTANNLNSNYVVLDSISVGNFKPISSPLAPTMSTLNRPLIMTSASANPNNMRIDPRILKRQERKIKNRESASISRKKKKDYLNSLEEQVKELADENKRLLEENASLKERLSFYEGNTKSPFTNISHKGSKPAIVLCVFLLVVGLNFNLSSNPFLLTKRTKFDMGSSDIPKLPDRHGRNLLWASEDNKETLKNHTLFSSLTMCPASINQTESARLVLELERWIGRPESNKNVSKPVNNSAAKQKPKPRRKKLRLDLSLAHIRNRELHGNELEVFNPKTDQLYSEFYEAINRQDDTFYVVSFSEQHMLLPALYHNKTRRPKMSLLMPSVIPNDSSTPTYITLMQIDCEVLDTKLINVKYGSIPRPYRHYGNVTKSHDTGESRPDNATSSRKNFKKAAYKPYFLSEKLLKDVDYN